MTVIVAARTAVDRVTIAADGETSYGWRKAYGAGPKLWVSNGLIFGAAGCKRTAQVLRHHVTWPKYRPDEETYEVFLVKTLVPAMRRGIAGHGVVELDNGYESHNADFLVAGLDQLGEVNGNGCAHVEASGRMAIGSGDAEALGYLGDEPADGRVYWREKDVIEAARRATLTAHGVGGLISVVDTKTLEVRDA